VSLGVGEAALGLGLLGAPLGTQIALIFAGNPVERHGPHRTVLIGVPVLAACQIAAVLAPDILTFFLCLTASGVAIGALEIVLNLEADRAEYQLGRRIMSRAHAFWSFGFFASGMLGAAAAQLGIPPVLHLLLVDAAAVALLFPALAGFTPAPARGLDAGKQPRFVVPTLGIIALVIVTLPAMLLEGAGIDWSVIFMRDTFEVSAFINGLAFALGAMTQAIVRYFADPVVDRYGPVRVARAMLILLGIGALMVTFSPTPTVALLGFALMGIGTSSIFPLAMSAAAQRTDRRAAANVAALAQLSFVVFLMAPPLLGFVAEHVGIRYAFGIGLPLVVLGLAFVKRFEPTR
jgi:MFS family permease